MGNMKVNASGIMLMAPFLKRLILPRVITMEFEQNIILMGRFMKKSATGLIISVGWKKNTLILEKFGVKRHTLMIISMGTRFFTTATVVRKAKYFTGMMRCTRNLIVAFTAGLSFLSTIDSVGASRPEDEINAYINKYPGEAAIYTLRKQQVNYKLVGDSVITTISVYEEMLHLGENTARYASDQVYSSSFSEVSDLKVYTLIPKKRK